MMSQLLNYWDRPASRRRRQIAAFTLVVVCGLFIVVFRQSIWNRSRLLFFQWQCERFVDTRKDVPVYGRNVSEDVDPPAPFDAHWGPPLRPEWKRWRDENPDIEISRGGIMGNGIAGRIPQCWRQYSSAAGLTWTILPAWAQGEEPEGMVFLGMLRAPSGAKKLVAVIGSSAPGIGKGRNRTFDVDIVTPAGVFSKLSSTKIEIRNDLRQSLSSKRPPIHQSPSLGMLLWILPVKIYPGQIDPSDPSAFRAKVTLGLLDLQGNVERWDDGWLIGKLVDSQTLTLDFEGSERFEAWSRELGARMESQMRLRPTTEEARNPYRSD